MIRFSNNTPTIEKIWFYTLNQYNSRLQHERRDILTSKIKIIHRKHYIKNKEGKYSAPDEELEIISYSAPQYYPYTNHIKSNVTRQLKYKHQYEIKLCIQKDENDNYSWKNSKIIWHVGSYKSWKIPSQKLVKTIYDSTNKKLIKKYTNVKTNKIDKDNIKLEKEKIKKTAKYLNVGDYNSCVNGINGDFYFRLQYIMSKYNCLYGKLSCKPQEVDNSVKYPFFDKHTIAVLLYLVDKGIIK